MDDVDERFMQRGARARRRGRRARARCPSVRSRSMRAVIVGRGSNRREMDRDPFAHAEMLRARGGCTPAGALAAERGHPLRHPGALRHVRRGAGPGPRRRLVFGAPTRRPARWVAVRPDRAARHNHRVEVRAGVLAGECAARLTRFFQGLRSPEG